MPWQIVFYRNDHTKVAPHENWRLCWKLWATYAKTNMQQKILGKIHKDYDSGKIINISPTWIFLKIRSPISIPKRYLFGGKSPSRFSVAIVWSVMMYGKNVHPWRWTWNSSSRRGWKIKEPFWMGDGCRFQPLILQGIPVYPEKLKQIPSTIQPLSPRLWCRWW